MEGLVDPSSIEHFDAKLKALQEHWNIHKTPYASEKGPQFFWLFKHIQVDVVWHHMHKDLGQADGLGSPSNLYYQ